MRRREFFGLIGAAALAGSLDARTQQPAIPVIGFLHLASETGMEPNPSVPFRFGRSRIYGR
jgi:hypothetical protein